MDMMKENLKIIGIIVEYMKEDVAHQSLIRDIT